MPRSDNEERADFMVRHGLVAAVWNEDGDLISATRSAAAPTRPAAPPGPAAKLADAFATRMKREHDVRFAASHFKPRLDVPVTEDQVPRAVLDKSAANGRAATKQQRR